MMRGWRVLALKGVTLADTSERASSDYVDVRGYDGFFSVIIAVGELGPGGALSFTAWTARDANGTDALQIEPVARPIFPVSHEKQPVTQAAVFDAMQLHGYLQIRAELIGPNGAVCYTFVGLPKYPAELGLGP